MIRAFNLFLRNLPEKLKRVTTGSKLIPEIDGLRFLAIFPVILQHFKERLERNQSAIKGDLDHITVGIFSNGHIGVYIFFFISGFILALPFAKEKLNNERHVSLSKYYLRRLTRLEPPYIICLTVFFLVLIIIKHQPFSGLIFHYLASFFYLHRIIFGVWSPINPVLWTLEVEVQFYIIAPFLTLLYYSLENKWLRRSLLVLLIILKIVLANTTLLWSNLGLTLPNLIEFFLVGILFCDIYVADWKEKVQSHWFFDILSVMALILVFSTWTWNKNILMKFVFIFSLFTLVYSLFRAVKINSFIRNPWITAIGGMCYSIYLIHLGFIEFFVAGFKKTFLMTSNLTLNFFIGLIILLPFLFLISSTFFLWVEKPCMNPNWPKELSKRIFFKKNRI